MKATQNPKFNVIIPTRERPDTLYHSLRTAVNQDYENLRIIVSDNCSQDNTKEVVASFTDRRIQYINTGKRLSMSHNWEFALGHVTDGWVTYLGDDDGLLPGALTRVAQVIGDTGCRAVTSRESFYLWPGSTQSDNQLTIPVTEGFEVRKSKEWLAKVMRGTALYKELPWLYQGGLAELALINSARNSDGSFFLSMIPDIYSALALASVTENYVKINEPIAIAGISAHSGGASTFGFGKSQVPADKFFSEENIPFHPTLGSARIASIPILVYESYLQTGHLHHDVLNIDMADQLALALTQTLPQQYLSIRNYCDEVARRNGCDIAYILKKENVLRRARWRRRLERLTQHWDVVWVNTRTFNVKDVYAAALLCKAIYVFDSRYRYWRWQKCKSLLDWRRWVRWARRGFAG